ncbi:hypothetical protein SS50377_23612 [Spironucleus salmonicida]|nr:hypothetical protein SS50377_23612 [Spironucleus salmonicida]
MVSFVTNFKPPERILEDFNLIYSYLDNRKVQYISQLRLTPLPFDWFFTPSNYIILAFSPKLTELQLQPYIQRQFLTAARLNLTDFFADLYLQFTEISKVGCCLFHCNYLELTKSILAQVVIFYLLANFRKHDIVCDAKNVKILTNKIKKLCQLTVLKVVSEFLEETKIELDFEDNLFLANNEIGIENLQTLILEQLKNELLASYEIEKFMNISNQIWIIAKSFRFEDSIENEICSLCSNYLKQIRTYDFEFLSFCDRNFKEKILNFDEMFDKQIMYFTKEFYDQHFMVNLEYNNEIPEYFSSQILCSFANYWDITVSQYVDKQKYKNIEDIRQVLRFIITNFGDAPELERAIQRAEWRDGEDSE